MTMLQEARAIAQTITAWRRELHAIPETGLLLPDTAAFVTARLREMGLTPQLYERHSGVTAVFGRGDGPTIALRADMDALPIVEEAALSFRAQNGNMHACGHDAHTAVVLGAAKLLKEWEGELAGQVKLIFQPAEEGPGGALPMIEDGVLEHPHVDAILGLHMEREPHPSIPGCKVGDVMVKYGNVTAADDQVDISIIGRGGHGSAPNLCVDPVTVASLVVTAIQHIVSREVSPFHPCVITIGSLLAGQGKENVIPDRAELRGTVRNQDLATRDFVFRRIEEVVKHITLAMRADYTIRFRDGYPPTANDPDMVRRFMASAAKLLPAEDIHLYTEDHMGGDDAGFFYQKVPGCFFRFYVPAPFGDGRVYPAHNARFVLEDSVLYRASAVMAQAALDYLQESGGRQAVKNHLDELDYGIKGE